MSKPHPVYSSVVPKRVRILDMWEPGNMTIKEFTSNPAGEEIRWLSLYEVRRKQREERAS